MDSRERRKRKREVAKRKKRRQIFIVVCLLVIALGACSVQRVLNENSPEPPQTEATEPVTTEATEQETETTTEQDTEASEETDATEAEEDTETTESETTVGYSDQIQRFSRVTKPAYITTTPAGGEVVQEVAEGDYLENYGVEDGYARVNFNEFGGYITDTALENASTDDTFKVIDGILIANKEYGLPESYEPGLKTEVSIQFEKMKSDMEGLGMVADIGSGFRSYEYQLGVIERNIEAYGEEETARSVAPAGHSEHQTGLAIDIINDQPEHNIVESFRDTEEGQWLAENSYKYGFILRYPEGKEDITGYMYEPWHFRYVGEEMAAKIFDSNLTLEEYFNLH